MFEKKPRSMKISLVFCRLQLILFICFSIVPIFDGILSISKVHPIATCFCCEMDMFQENIFFLNFEDSFPLFWTGFELTTPSYIPHRVWIKWGI